MVALDHAAYCDAISREGHALAAAARASGVAAAVPSCPDWHVADLLGHVGRLHRYVTGIIEAPDDDQSVQWAKGEPPAPDARVEWFDEGVDLVAGALRGADPGAAAWSWTNDATVGFWARRQANETAVHRWDAQGAAGSVEPIEQPLAVDGIDEFFGLLPYWGGVAGLRGTGESIHLHATDGDGEWLLRLAADAVIVSREHAKGDVAARGAASDLLLFLYGRVARADLEVFGDGSLLDRWQEIVRW